MKAPDQPDRRRRLGPSHKLLTPFFIFALAAAVASWFAAWVFKDIYELTVTLVSIGCFLLVVAVCACLFVLVNRPERGG